MTDAVTTFLLPLLLGWLLDAAFGDPERLPHLVVMFGKLTGKGERWLNQGRHRRLKGGAMAVALICLAWLATAVVMRAAGALGSACPAFGWLEAGVGSVLVFYCLAGTTLIREVRAVFAALGRSLDDGRRQVARIVGRDTSELSAQEVRTAALETLAENLSDGVVAPLFWYAVGGLPCMVAYKMVNTLDSMIGYRTVRYRDFGRMAARTDDVANFIPARLTAILMVLADAMLYRQWGKVAQRLRFVARYGPRHASPNSGWPESALAGALDCRFGGAHRYFGEYFPKPYIGDNDRPLATDDMRKAIRINRCAELLMLALAALAGTTARL